jgi:methionine-rich copper-binding protein CopC
MRPRRQVATRPAGPPASASHSLSFNPGKRITGLAAAACLIGHTAFAHAHLEQSSPPINSDLTVAPSAVTITFSEGVEPRFSTIVVQDFQGAQVDKADHHPTGGNNRQLSVSLPKLGAGTYTVIWHATAVDTHKIEGHFTFTVKP